MMLLAFIAANAFGSGPRYVTGPPFFTGRAGVAIGWKQPVLRYFTDPGDLSATVNHQAADALVQAAASIWNVPVASITVSAGGALAEHVSGQNVYLSSTGMVFPEDVMAANAGSIPLAVIYDSDGSVTDMLLGAGASDPSGCRQNAVIESVDAFDQNGYILHAMLVLNGRCTGSDAAQQMQMRYQLERAFGRVLGLAWSQTNDNVFTGVPVPTYQQAMHWPIMHPLDIVCGPYTYQCLPVPFTLRPDDVASLVAVYPVMQGMTPGPGKALSLQAAHTATGTVTFPTGQGMAGVNAVVRRQTNMTGNAERWFETSAVTGSYFVQSATSSFVDAAPTAENSFGVAQWELEGKYAMAYVPIDGAGEWQNLVTSVEPVNELYTGNYSLGPYGAGLVTPSGGNPAAQTSLVVSHFSGATVDFAVGDAARQCGSGTDGVFVAPAQVATTGWWNGLLCGYGHAAYVALGVKPGRTLTVEVTALDELGRVSQAKAMPVIAVYATADTASDAPSRGLTATAFGGQGYGMTSLAVGAARAGDTALRIGIADQRGDGRPDFFYQGRVLFGDTVQPERVTGAGGRVTVTGMGFRNGNSVSVNGVEATVQSWTATALQVTLPTMAAAHAVSGTAVDVVIRDRGTGASSVMTDAVFYDDAPVKPDQLQVMSQQDATAYVGAVTSQVFAVRVMKGDGVTAVAGAGIVFRTVGGVATLGACGQSVCAVVTGLDGVASTTVTPGAEGAISVRAEYRTLTATENFGAELQAVGMRVLRVPSGPVNVGEEAQPQFIVLLVGPHRGDGLPNRTVKFSAATGSVTFAGCAAAVCSVTTDVYGVAAIVATPNTAGTVTLQAEGDGQAASTTFTAVQVRYALQVVSAPRATAFLNESAGTFQVHLVRTDGGSVPFYQQVLFTADDGLQLGSCGTNQCTLTSDTTGNVATSVSAVKVGSYTVQARYGAVVQSVTVTVTERTQRLQILAAPSGQIALGVTASRVFSAQVLDFDGVTPLRGISITLAGPEDAVKLGCGLGTCQLYVDGDGVATTTVRPLKTGKLFLSATYSPFAEGVSVEVVGHLTMQLMTKPPTDAIYVGDTVQLAVQVTGADGLSRVPNEHVTFSGTDGVVSIGSCGVADCVLTTDGDGVASVGLTARKTGVVTVTVSDGPANVITQFTVAVRQDQMQVVSAPGPTLAGDVAQMPFVVKVTAADGLTAGAGRLVTLAVTQGSATLLACGAAVCVLTADAQGLVRTDVMTASAGAVELTSSEGAAVSAKAFFVVTAKPDLIRVVMAPLDGSATGVVAGQGFQVQVMTADGRTAAVGRAVTLSVQQGRADLGACGEASTCVVNTDLDGMVTTTVTPRSAGQIVLQARDAGVSVQAGFIAVTPVVKYSPALSASEGSVYVAEGAQVELLLGVDATVNGVAAAGVAVSWQGAAGLVAKNAAGVSDAGGHAQVAVIAGSLAGGVATRLTGCAWTLVCVVMPVIAVAESDWRLRILSGAGQSVSAGTPFQHVTAMVTNAAGNAVAGAAVTVFQAVRAVAEACPEKGRCPAAPILASVITVVNTDQSGGVEVVPLAMLDGAVPIGGTETEILLTAGTNAATGTTLRRQP